MKTKYINAFIAMALSGAMGLSSCKKFLDAKPNINLEIPSTLNDLQTVLDMYLYLNAYGSSVMETASDDHYVTTTIYNAGDVNNRNNYIWAANAEFYNNYSEPYDGDVYYANVVLDNLDKVPNTDKDAYNRIKGSALFYRSFGFYQLSQLYAAPYNKDAANSGLGIALRLTASITQPATRSTVAQTYSQIINDLKTAADLLPLSSSFNSRPNKASAYAMLARVYLEMQDYQNAYMYSNLSLNIYDTLIDYNSLDTTILRPFPSNPTQNTEVTFLFNTTQGIFESVSRGNVDSNLYRSYSANDLRRVLFFKKVNGVTGFYGTYSGGIFLGWLRTKPI